MCKMSNINRTKREDAPKELMDTFSRYCVLDRVKLQNSGRAESKSDMFPSNLIFKMTLKFNLVVCHLPLSFEGSQSVKNDSVSQSPIEVQGPRHGFWVIRYNVERYFAK